MTANYLVLAPGLGLGPVVSRFLNMDTAQIVRLPHGTLVLFQTEHLPMWARDIGDEAARVNCTRDLEFEIALQRFLGGLPLTQFHLKRVGRQQRDYRGRWEAHPFHDHPEVAAIEREFAGHVESL